MGGDEGEGRGSLSVYSTHMNGRNLAKKLSPNIFLLSPWETGEEAWSRVTGTSQKKLKTLGTLLPLCELGSRADLITHQIMSVFYFFAATLAPSCSAESRAAPLFFRNRADVLIRGCKNASDDTN